MTYEQIGAGKTYTMFGKTLSENKNNVVMKRNKNENSIVQRAIKQIFEYKNKAQDRLVTVHVSFMKINLNQITDLLKKYNDIIFSADKQEFKIGEKKSKFNIENSSKLNIIKMGEFI